jgi:transcriptional regulator with XRE-family HTH domain
MNSRNNNHHSSLSRALKNRRGELRMSLLQVAERMRVTAEAISHWEKGTRRMELDKLPRLAAILQLNGQYLCQLALFEFHPALYAALFGPEPPKQQIDVAPSGGRPSVAIAEELCTR